MHTTSQRTVPIAQPQVTEEEKRRVIEVLESGYLVAGRWVKRFEEAFATYVGAAHAVATSSGTTGLMVAVEAAGIAPGASVITTPFSFGATANALLHRGARPVFADIDPRTYNLDPDAVAEALDRTPNVQGVLLVHLYGLPCRMDAFVDMTKTRGIALIEDAAQAHGAAFHGRKVGAFGTAGVFSLYPTKNLMTGEGGLLVTNDDAVADLARLLVNCGSRTQYVYEVLGYNFRMTEVAGALGATQLAYLDARNARRRENAHRLTTALADLDWLVLPYEPPGCLHVYHQYTIRVPRARDRLIQHLDAHGIGHRVYYPIPIHRTPLYQREGYGAGRFPEAERASEEVLSIPVHPALDDEALDRVIHAIRSFVPRG